MNKVLIMVCPLKPQDFPRATKLPGMSAYDFCWLFFSATTLQYKQLKIEFYFSNESYNEEQEIESIILPTGSFLCQSHEKNCIESASLFLF